VTDDNSPIILAFSGGLDTSFCVPWLKENYGRDVITATVDTGGIDDAAATALEDRAFRLGAIEHVLLDCKKDFFDSVLRYLIAGNVRRGQFYPLCVGAERGLQASRLAGLASERGAATVAHGCTAAGNDQVRFEVALRTLNPGLEILAPVRDNSWIRDEQLKYLADHDLPLPAQGSAYSVNRGLWGITIGGQETLTSERSLPEEAWVLSAGAFDRPKSESHHTLDFDAGIPVALDGKGRVAFEAPAALILITAHRELEKLVLSAQQSRVKDGVASVYGDLIHEGKQLDAACRDIEALLSSSQRRVTGQVSFTLRPGNLFIDGVGSPYSLLAATKGVYGETAGEWTAEDALGYARILSLSGSLQTRAGASTGKG
jgi:argininosuccinate synthase